jgi:hypothetical protein
MSIQLGTAARVAAVVAAVALATPAVAITCRNGTQLVQGSWIATPYCQDLYLAQVARERGYPVSAEKIRNNPNYKKELCRSIFADIRISETCRSAGVPEWNGGAR